MSKYLDHSKCAFKFKTCVHKKEHLAALVAIGVEVADDALRLFGDLEEVLLLGDLLVLAVAVLDPLLPLLLLTLHR